MLVTPLVLVQISARECWLTDQNAGLTLEMRVTWYVCNWHSITANLPVEVYLYIGYYSHTKF